MFGGSCADKLLASDEEESWESAEGNSEKVLGHKSRMGAGSNEEVTVWRDASTGGAEIIEERVLWRDASPCGE